MSILKSMPQQYQRKDWGTERLGKFTASVIGDLFTFGNLKESDAAEFDHLLPEGDRWRVLKSGPRKGEKERPSGFTTKLKAAMKEKGVIRFGDGAMSLIKDKAVERLTGEEEWSPNTPSMRRGILLEHAAKYLLNKFWKKLVNCTFLTIGENGGATPDALEVGESGVEATVDIKCPEKNRKVLDFAREVKDGDFESLLKWDPLYAWQIMAQAKAAGVRWAWLVVFTDKLPAIRLSVEDGEKCQMLLEDMALKYSQEDAYPWNYDWKSPGFYYSAKRFELTDERSEEIDKVLAAAEVECIDEMIAYGDVIGVELNEEEE